VDVSEEDRLERWVEALCDLTPCDSLVAEQHDSGDHLAETFARVDVHLHRHSS
jgi:hypothetical protein